MSRITQKGANGPLAFQANGQFQSSTDINLATLVGTRWDLSDGREVILVSNSAASATTVGQLYQDAAIVPNHQNIAVSSFTAYSNNGNVPASLVVTLGNTLITANQYQGGFVVVNDVTGEGQTLRIASHGAAAASGTVSIVLEDGPNTALTSSSEVCLIPAHGANVVPFPIVATGAAVGIGLYPIPAASTSAPSFGFMTSKGITSALSDAAVAPVGAGISQSVTIVGAVTLSNGTNAVIGYANQTAVSTEHRSVVVNL